MAELGAFFGNPNIQRQGARARALAGQRDVNTLADPRTYAIVQGLLGTAPDQMGLSVLNPDYEKIRKAAEPAFALGLLGQAAPLLVPVASGANRAAMAVGRAGERYAERVVPQIMERGGLPAGLLQDLAQGTTSKIFIGSKSRAWDKDAAELAKKLDKKGESAEAIWEKTGTFKSPDGKWRQEISDQNIELRSENIGLDREGNPIFLPVTEGNASRVMAHPELYNAYPFLKKVNTEIGIKPKTAGSAEYGDEGRFIEAYGPTDEEIKSALVHEMQHQVQNREGMAAGSGFISGDEKDFQRYLRAAGEAEARAAQARRNLSMEERRKLFPLSSYDVPISELDASLPQKLDFGFSRSLLE
jgi:hypothetical protein